LVVAPGEARQALAGLVAGWRDNGRRSFAIADLADFRATTGLSRGWLYNALGELEDQDAIAKADKAAQWDLTA